MKDAGVEQINEWEKWFRESHERRLMSVTEFPDIHLRDAERRRIDEVATAIVGKMKADYLRNKAR
jgi:hypothetical protein